MSSIYILECGGYYKIGKSYNAERRIKELSKFTPFKIKKIKTWDFYKPYKMEHYLHRYFHRYLETGEWFKLNKKIIDQLIICLNMLEKQNEQRKKWTPSKFYLEAFFKENLKI